MNQLFTRVTAAAVPLALAGAVVVLAAVPAAATPSGGSSSYGAAAPSGATTATPQGLATSTGTALVLAPNVDIAGLLTTGLTLDTASTVAAYSRVTSVNAQISGSGHTMRLTASQVASTCNSGTTTASANLINGVLTVDGTAVSLPSHPTEDQTLTFSAGTVALNDQISATGGGLEDQAVHIHFNSPAQDLYLAVTVCNASSSSNTITVTNPGAQGPSNSGTAITPLSIVATDTDTSQTLTYAATGLPAGLSINTTTGVISGTPTTGASSPSSVTVTVHDTSGASGSATFNWTVHNVVTVTNPGSQSGTVGTAVNLTVSATDTNSSITTFTWSATGLPTGLSINSSTGAITGTPTTQTGSPFTVHVTATDSTTATNTATFTFTITSPNTVTVTNPGTQFSTQGEPITPLTITVNDTAVTTPGTITCAATGNVPAGLSFNTSTCTFTGTPTLAEGVTVIVTATDATGAHGSATFNWEVIGGA